MSSLYFGRRDDTGTSVFEGMIVFSDDNFNRAMGALSTDPVIGFVETTTMIDQLDGDGKVIGQVPQTQRNPATPEQLLQSLVVFVRETIFAKVNGILQDQTRKAAIAAADAQFTPISEEKT